jgi:2-polyprenyl-6-methoxyphenol hydroxylase-like FAD-dependent oxidoreductase
MEIETNSTTPNKKHFHRTIIMGASVAGLWTARALSDHFDEVLVIERDQLPEGAEFRSGVPQARQYHTLLLAGLCQMEIWFPGLRQELIEDGAIPYDPVRDVRWRLHDRWYPQFDSKQILLSCSRLLLESRIRKRMRQNPCIHFIAGLEVSGLALDADQRRVIGVKTKERRGGSAYGSADPVHQADLIVDALGRRSQTPEWLIELGYAAPRESEVDSFLGYVTRRYKRKPNTPMLLVGPMPPNDPYAALIFPEESDTMVALIAGYNKNYPPTDPAEFDAFAHKLGPEFEAALQGAEPISQPYGYRGTSSRWRHYEELDRWPERFVVLGDAFCGFNPIYGQGMTVAAMSAVALAKHIQKSDGNLDGMARPVLQQISKITQAIWLLATSADLEWPGTTGGTSSNSLMDRFGRWYVNKLLEASAFDRQARLQFLAVNQLTKPGTALFAPHIFLRVMWQTFFRKKT